MWFCDTRNLINHVDIMMNLEDINLVIFDVGGVLRDSSYALNESYKRAFEEVGLDYKFTVKDTWHLRGVGKYFNSRNFMKAVVSVSKKQYNLSAIVEKPDAETIIDEIISGNFSDSDLKNLNLMLYTYKTYFNSKEVKKLINPIGGSEEGIKSLKEKGYKLAVLSNSSSVTIRRDIPYSNLFNLVLSEEDVKNKKPSGEGLAKICNRMNVEPSGAVYVGDVTDDILASRDANCHSIAVLTGMGLRIHLEAKMPDLICKDVLEVSAKFKPKNR